MGICASHAAADDLVTTDEAEEEQNPQAPADPTLLMWCEQEEYDEVRVLSIHCAWCPSLHHGTTRVFSRTPRRLLMRSNPECYPNVTQLVDSVKQSTGAALMVTLTPNILGAIHGHIRC